MITQNIKESNVIKVARENKRLTLENVVMKTNVKLGGINYSLDIKTMNGSRYV